MSTFEIVSGVEGYCLVLDGTRICGPKPWGGGRIVRTFRTDGIYEAINKGELERLKAERDRLREERREYQATIDSLVDECADHEAENAKLREMVARVDRARRDLCDAYPDAEQLDCEECPAWHACRGDLMERLRELGIEVKK